MIRVLPPEIANRIAAGEVVERPASVVKELVENALDAGARRVRVEVEEGGRKLIRVTDDGDGMGSEDLARALLPHATSKIGSVEDLDSVASYGFRGEALASIASVSRTVITTRQAGVPLGSRIVSDGGIHGPVEPAGAPFGTTVEVHNLFFNVPARRAFLKADRFELAQVIEVLTRLALPDPDWTLELVSNGKCVLSSSGGGGERGRLADLFGSDLAASLVPLSGARGGARIKGFASPPSVTRTSTRFQHLFVNGRWIRDRRLSYAVVEAYRGLIMPRDYPVTFLMLALDPAQVDVNVHPAKTEVRFRDPDLLFGLVLRTLRPVLEGAGPRPLAQETSAAVWTGAERPAASYPEAVAESTAPSLPFDAPATGPDVRGPAPLPAPRFMQVHRSYVVAEVGDGIRILDQHALHERKLYDELMARLAGSRGEDQLLLVPCVADFQPADRELLIGHAAALARLGLLIEPFGPRGVALKSVPMPLAKAAPDGVLSAVVDTLREAGSVSAKDVIADVIAHVACKAAVKFHDALPEDEVRALLAWEEAHPEARNCPHGRTTSLHLSLRELETRFQRKK